MMVLMKLDMIMDNQREGLGLLRQLITASTPVDDDLMEDVLPAPLETSIDIDNMEVKLSDGSFRKKLVCMCKQC